MAIIRILIVSITSLSAPCGTKEQQPEPLAVPSPCSPDTFGSSRFLNDLICSSESPFWLSFVIVVQFVLLSCCYFLHYSCQLGAFSPYSNYYHYHLYAAPLKTWFSSLAASSPPPPPLSSSSVYCMIQLGSHQIKGHGCNQSFESIHLSSLFLLMLQLWLFADLPLLLWKFERINFRSTETRPDDQSLWNYRKLDLDADIGVRVEMTRVGCSLSKLNLSDGTLDRVSQAPFSSGPPLAPMLCVISFILMEVQG